MSKEHAAKVMQEIFSQGTYEGDLLGIHEGRKISDTPRTDVAEHNMGSIVEPHYVVDADFSRYLERELAEARGDVEHLEREIANESAKITDYANYLADSIAANKILGNGWDGALATVQRLERELAEAREELNDRRKFCYDVEQALDGLKGAYVEIIKELRKDAERYRWLRKGGIDHLLHGRLQELDAAIDAAMKEGK